MDQKKLEEIFEKMCRKAARNAEIIGTDLREFPARQDGNYFAPERDCLRKTTHIFCWTQSFFTGMAMLAASHRGENSLVRWCESLYEDYRRKVFDTPADTMHDLGFLYTLYSTMCYKLTGDRKMRELSIRAAEVLAHRYLPACKCIRAWGRMDDSLPDYLEPELYTNNFFTNSHGLAIIDCMMNLPLLFWAGKETGDTFFTSIACAHADTTLKYFIREDGSVCHAYRFDQETGEPVGEFNDCGYGIGSHWARGTAWAVYGFAIAWRYTGLQRYRDAAKKLAYKYLAECGDDPIPVWDFRLPADQPARYCGFNKDWTYWDAARPENKIYNVDTSAAAIMACGFLELLAREPDEQLRQYVDRTAQALIPYLDLDEDHPGLLSHVNGNCSYACFGDYYAMELLARLLGEQTPW